MRLYLSILAYCLLAGGAVNAAEAPVLDRPVLIGDGGAELWLRYDLFNTGMDVLNYRGRFNSSTVFNQYDRWKLGVSHAPFAWGAWKATVFWSQQQLSRQLQPTKINNRYHGFSFAWQQSLLTKPWGKTVLEFGVSNQRSPELVFDRYNTSANVEIIAAPGKHLITMSAWSKEWRLVLRQRWQASSRWIFHGSLGYRQLQIQSTMNSYDPIVRASLRSPQNEPWRERHIVANVDAEWRFHPIWTASIGWQHMQISRQNYHQISGNADYNDQDSINTHIYYHINRSLTCYLRGQANTHFLLGDAALAYNSRTSSRFNAPFGFLSMGASLSF